uniref:Uncharacterized protein n=1 Tax=Rhizophora mucronata TaxID=61149 RepID=A0A2P2IWG0_RHIMU
MDLPIMQRNPLEGVVQQLLHSNKSLLFHAHTQTMIQTIFLSQRKANDHSCSLTQVRDAMKRQCCKHISRIKLLLAFIPIF